MSGLRRVVGRPALVGDGAEPHLLLWAERRGERLDLQGVVVDKSRTTGAFSLGRLTVERWEPTFDGAAVARGDLRLLLPLRLERSPDDGVEAAVVTWPLRSLR